MPTPIQTLNLSVRATNCLLAEDMTTVEQVADFIRKHGRNGLLRIPNLGRKWADEVMAAVGGEHDTPEQQRDELAADNAAMLRLISDIRFALGDNGKRMQPELVEYAKEIVKQRDDLINKLDRHQKEAAIGRAVNRACMDLPLGYELHIELEKDAGTVSLYRPDGEEVDEEFHDCDYFSSAIENAINVAISKAEKGGAT